MKVLVTGATGFVGKHIIRKLVEQNYQVVVLSRDSERAKKELRYPFEFFNWQPQKEAAPVAAFAGVDAVIHLLGESIAAKRWSDDQKRKIHDSRTVGTKNLLQGLRQSGQKLKAFVSTSAVGIYDRTSGERELTEKDPAGTGFLADVCKDWEAAVAPLLEEKLSDRLVILRVGVVLGLEGGALQKLMPIFKLGVGGPVGDGHQWMSWIHVEDLANLYVKSLTDSKLSGVINAVAPSPVRNNEFSKALGQALHRPAFLPAPAFALKLAMGEMSSIILDSQKVAASKLKEQGYQFQFPKIKDAFADLTGLKKKAPTLAGT